METGDFHTILVVYPRIPQLLPTLIAKIGLEMKATLLDVAPNAIADKGRGCSTFRRDLHTSTHLENNYLKVCSKKHVSAAHSCTSSATQASPNINFQSTHHR